MRTVLEAVRLQVMEETAVSAARAVLEERQPRQGAFRQSWEAIDPRVEVRQEVLRQRVVRVPQLKLPWYRRVGAPPAQRVEAQVLGAQLRRAAVKLHLEVRPRRAVVELQPVV